jgi:hypothetical protein
VRIDRKCNLLKIVSKVVFAISDIHFQIQAPQSWYLRAAPTSQKAFYLGRSPEV